MKQEIERIIRQVISGEDNTARTLFLTNFRDEIEGFILSMVSSFERWDEFNLEIGENIDRGKISNLIYHCLNSNVVSMDLFVSGHFSPSGNTMRQVLESISMAILSSKPDLGFLERFSQNKYSTTKSIRDVIRHSEKLNISKKSIKIFEKEERFYSQFSHLTIMTIALNESFSDPENKPLGSYFDEGKIQEYKNEVDSRIKLVNILPNLIQGIEDNLRNRQI